ncbi:MAG: bifunctional phosphoglucose/phosphomannose isomerase [Limnochordaceae bacterium]|nr:bifunctional phosphoglucose/phosphomannose isomerase [Limnochordaceae bacterium]
MAQSRAAGEAGGLTPAALEEIRQRLDDPAAVARLDPYGMLRLIDGLTEQIQAGYDIGRRAAADPPKGGWRSVVIAGMGGSAIGGDLVGAIAADFSPVPVAVARDYRIPAYVDGHTLFVASSYSGNTEETLAAQEQAQKAGARIVALTSGGRLGDLAAQKGWPTARLPSGLPPRAALGYSLFAAIGILEAAGLLPEMQTPVEQSIRAVEAVRQRCAMARSLKDNPAKQEALELVDRVPIVYGSSGIGASVAYRWKCQFNENSKHPAYWTSLPELDHNEVVGWEAPPPSAARLLRILMLEVGDESPRMERRFEATRRILEGRASSMVTLRGEGEGHLARALSVLHLGDYVTFYLAIAKGVDPTPVRFIDRLKAELATMR